jgi:hypothetical protein
MAERIVSPGVFARERDLSFLPQGITEIGAAIIGPTVKGPAFVPTIVRNFEEYEKIFGGYDSDYYTPFTVKNYLDSAGSVTIVKVGYLGGYKVTGVNLVLSGSKNFKEVVATFLPARNNSNGEGNISASLAAGSTGASAFGTRISASQFTLDIGGGSTTASISGLTLDMGSVSNKVANFLGSQIPTVAGADKIGSTNAPAYMYKFFGTSVSASFAKPDNLFRSDFTSGSSRNAITASVYLERSVNGFDFSTGTETVDTSDGNYITTITGNSDAASARTPFIQSQLIGTSRTDLFKIYMRAAGTDTNNHYAIIRDIKKPQNSNSSPDYAEFGISIHNLAGTLLESFGNLNLDPDSANYLPKVVGDMFETVNNDGEVTTYGDFPNLSQYIRVGDYKEDVFRSNSNLQPMGYDAVIEPIISTASCPTASFSKQQAYAVNGGGYANHTKAGATYNENIPYGFKILSRYSDDELANSKAYLSPIPKDANSGNNITMSLEDMNGFGIATDSTFTNDSTFTVHTSKLTIASSVKQLKFAVPMQFGFDGINPAAPKQTGTSISSTNVMGFDCSTTTASGSIAYKRAINAVSNPDEYDINMLVTPGIIHKHHSIVTNHAIDKVEARADAFYVMDGSDIDDSVAQAVSNVTNLDTNYVATYYPWVRMDDPSRSSGTIYVPPSVVIPGVIAFTDSVAHEWFAPAGLNRGGLTNVRMTKKKLTHTDRDTLYEGRVNPIASFPGQGVVVFGQKTLQAKPSALDRINVRRLLIRLKKFIASSSRFLVFEQNDSSTRARFLNIVNPFLESVQANSGLSAFKVVMDDSNNTPDVVDRNQLVGQIFIQPTRTAEFIVLDFSVLPTGAAFPE